MKWRVRFIKVERLKWGFWILFDFVKITIAKKTKSCLSKQKNNEKKIRRFGTIVTMLNKLIGKIIYHTVQCIIR